MNPLPPTTLPTPTKQKFAKTGNTTIDGLMTGGGDFVRFFKPHVKHATPNEKHVIAGRILPAHNPAIPATDVQAFSMGVLPYRVCRPEQMTSADQLDKERNVPNVTNWAQGFAGYRMWGSRKMDIISPRTRNVYPELQVNIAKEDMADPMDDILRVLKMLAKSEPRWSALFESTKDNKYPVMAKCRVFSMMNMWARLGTDQAAVAENLVAYIPQAGYGELLNRLAYPTPHGTQPRDPNWSEFIYGDVTDPNTGLWAWSAVATLGTITATTFGFSRAGNTLEGSYTVPVTPQVIADRYPLNASLFNIMTYQQIVDLIVDDGCIPYEVVQQACGNSAIIPPKRSSTVFNFGAAPAPAVGQHFAPPPGAPEPRFHASLNGQVWPDTLPLSAIGAFATQYPGVVFLDVSNPSGAWAQAIEILNAAASQAPSFQPAPAQPQGFSMPAGFQPPPPAAGFQPPQQSPAGFQPPPAQPPAQPAGFQPPPAQPPAQPAAGFQPPVQPAGFQPPPAPTTAQPAGFQPPAQPPQQPPAQPPVQQQSPQMFWVGTQGRTLETQIPLAQIAQTLAQYPDARFCANGASVWQEASQIPGALPVTTPVGGTVTPPPAAPAAPAAAPAAALGSALPALTADELKERAELTKMMENPNAAPSMHLVERMLELDKRAVANNQ